MCVCERENLANRNPNRDLNPELVPDLTKTKFGKATEILFLNLCLFCLSELGFRVRLSLKVKVRVQALIRVVPIMVLECYRCVRQKGDILGPEHVIPTPERLLLKYVASYLSWADWESLSVVDLATREWCSSNDASRSLWGLWDELSRKPHPYFSPGYELDSRKDSRYTFSELHVQDWRLLAVEESLKGGDVFCGGFNCSLCRPTVADNWLVIWAEDMEDLSRVPPYLMLPLSVPKGLKLQVIGSGELSYHTPPSSTQDGGSRVKDPAALCQRLLPAVGKLAALGLKGLVLTCSENEASIVLNSFLATLQTLGCGGTSPLQTLSFSSQISRWTVPRYLVDRLASAIVDFCRLPALRYLKFDLLEWVPAFRRLPLACRNLRVFEMGEDFRYPSDFRWALLENGACNLITLRDMQSFCECRTFPHLFTLCVGFNYNIIPAIKAGLFPVLRSFNYSPAFDTSSHEAQEEEISFYPGLIRALAAGCPNLRCLCINAPMRFMAELEAIGEPECQGLLKRLMKLGAISMIAKPGVSLNINFPVGCELKELVVGDAMDCGLAESYLLSLLEIQPTHLPHLKSVVLHGPNEADWTWNLLRADGNQRVLLRNIRREWVDWQLSCAYFSEIFGERSISFRFCLHLMGEGFHNLMDEFMGSFHNIVNEINEFRGAGGDEEQSSSDDNSLDSESSDGENGAYYYSDESYDTEDAVADENNEHAEDAAADLDGSGTDGTDG